MTQKKYWVKKTPRAKEVPSKLSQKTLELLAEAAESAFDAGLPKLSQPTLQITL